MPDTPNVSSWSSPAAELLQSHCRQIEAYGQPEDAAEREPAARRRAPMALGSLRAELPPTMQALLERYEATHPGTRLEPLRYLSTGYAEAGMSGTSEPLEGDVVSLSLTETIVDSEIIQVGSRVLIARRVSTSPSKEHRG